VHGYTYINKRLPGYQTEPWSWFTISDIINPEILVWRQIERSGLKCLRTGVEVKWPLNSSKAD